MAEPRITELARQGIYPDPDCQRCDGKGWECHDGRKHECTRCSAIRDRWAQWWGLCRECRARCLDTCQAYPNLPDGCSYLLAHLHPTKEITTMPDPNDLSPREVEELRSEIALLRAALYSAEADLSLLRFPADNTIPWGKGGVPKKHEVDETIAKAHKALGYH